MRQLIAVVLLLVGGAAIAGDSVMTPFTVNGQSSSGQANKYFTFGSRSAYGTVVQQTVNVSEAGNYLVEFYSGATGAPDSKIRLAMTVGSTTVAEEVFGMRTDDGASTDWANPILMKRLVTLNPGTYGLQLAGIAGGGVTLAGGYMSLTKVTGDVTAQSTGGTGGGCGACGGGPGGDDGGSTYIP